jgi:IPT/TIG domain
MRSSTWALAAGVLAVALFAAGCGGGGSSGGGSGPVIAAVSPASGGVGGGTSIEITGSGLANSGVGTNQVTIGGVPAVHVVVVSGSKITCETPPGSAGPVDVAVKKNSGTGTMPGAFTYYPPPTLASISPDDGSKVGGLPVTITGTGFVNNNPGVTILRFGQYIVNQFTIVNDTTITCNTPAVYLEGKYDISVTNDNGKATLPLAFNFGGPPPELYSVTPGSGPVAGNTQITLSGANFTISAGTHQVRVNGISAIGVVRVNDGTITCYTPASTIAAAVDVSVSNTNGMVTLPGAFTYIAPPPSITSVSPNRGFSVGGDAATITGSGFMNFNAGTNTVTFGGTAATSVVVVNDTKITCVTPAHSDGSVNVVVSNNRGMATLTGAFLYYSPTLYVAVGNYGSTGSLYKVNPSTGSTTAVASISVPITGLAIAPDGTMYGSTSSSYPPYAGSNLVVIDPSTGSVSTIGNLGGQPVTDLMFIGSQLYGSGKYSGLLKIDTTSASITTIGGYSYFGGGGLTYDPASGKAYVGNYTTFYSIDVTTGSVSTIGYYSNYPPAGFAIHQGKFFGVRGYGYWELDTVDPSSGATSYLAYLPAPVDAIASNAP